MNNKSTFETSERLGEFDLWKFIFSIVVVILHSSHLPATAEKTYLIGGSIGVEFFFLVSGFFLAKSALRTTNYDTLGTATWRFLRKKAAGFSPICCLAMECLLSSKPFFRAAAVHSCAIISS